MGTEKLTFPNTTEILTLPKVTDAKQFVKRFETLSSDTNRVFGIFELMKYPLTILVEENYIDKVFRDSYYAFYSHKHFDIPRECKRITFFNCEFSHEDLYDDNMKEKLQENLIGFTIIRPLAKGCVGRTFLDVNKLKKTPKIYALSTRYNFTVLGLGLYVNAFPFSSQDSETMTCAETTVWSILEYYGTKSPKFRTINPSEISTIICRNSPGRVLPTAGLNYMSVASLLKEFGFESQLYFSKAYGKAEVDFKRIFHYYIESGIPLGVAISAKQKTNSIQHSIVCIGHAEQRSDFPASEKLGSFNVVDTADLYDHYVLMDDSSLPYKIKPFSQFIDATDVKIDGFVVPLPKHCFLEASDAKSIAMRMLFEENFALKSEILNFGLDHVYHPENNPIVIRMYLTESDKFKSFKRKQKIDTKLKQIYTSLSFPKYIWVAEVSLKSLYLRQEVFGEIVIDATASRYDNLKATILFKCSNCIGWRERDDDLTFLWDMLEYQYDFIGKVFEQYKCNICISPDDTPGTVAKKQQL